MSNKVIVDTKSNKLPDIHALWIGGELSQISQCCLKSFMMRGHKVFLHTYTKFIGLSEGIQQVDANQIIPESKIFRHTKTGSYALFSDVFRYQLLQKYDGIYIDCDVYCLKPVSIPVHGYLFGYEDDTKINGAILALPKGSDLLNQLIEASNNPKFIPPWYRKRTRLFMKIKKKLNLGVHVSDMPWGVIGPEAITYFVNELDLLGKVQPIDIYYPVHYLCISQLLDISLNIDDITTSRTKCIHLFNEMLRGKNIENISKDCILSKMMKNEI